MNTKTMSRYLTAVKILGALLLFGLGMSHTHAAGVTVERLQIKRFALPATGPTLIHLPYFDSRGEVRLEEAPVSQPPAGVCDKTAYVRAVLARPRVDHWKCADGKGYLADPMGSWKRALEYVSGSRRLTLYVLGASAAGLVLSDLEVWSPATGETLRAAPVRELAGERRSVPRYSFSRTGAFAARDAFFLHAAASEIKGGAGVYRFIAATGDAQLLMPPRRDRFAPVEVAEIQLDETGRYLLLGELSLFRGPNWTQFVVFDLVRRERVFEQRHGEGSIVHEPRIVVGPAGRVAFAYRDGGKRETVLVEYRLRQ